MQFDWKQQSINRSSQFHYGKKLDNTMLNAKDILKRQSKLNRNKTDT